MALGLYPDGGRDLGRYDHLIDEIAELGATHVALVVTWVQDDVRSTSVAAGEETIDDATLGHVIAHAHGRGLRVLVFPILTLRKIAPGQWRGTIQPADVDVWWLAYERFILHYAAIAARERATALLVGSELGSTEAWTYRWYHLISAVKRIYGGALLYSANWDHYQQVGFWRRLDAIGVTGYFELTRDKDASEEVLTAAWAEIRDALVAFARERKKPLWITEVGYTSVDGAATRPWDYVMSGPIDHEEQRRAYAAFVAAWGGVAELGAVFFWNWWGEGGDRDRGYTPKNKPAGAILRTWYGER